MILFYLIEGVMGYKFKTGSGDGREWKERPDTLEVDYHDGKNYGMEF
jgi:hypothetical protein